MRPSGRLVRAREAQPLNAQSPMLVMPSGRLVRAREVQPSKAWSPMLVRPSGRLVSVREVQLPKARSPIQRQDTQDKTEQCIWTYRTVLTGRFKDSAYGEIQRQCLRGDSKTVLRGQCICTVNPAGNLDRRVPLRDGGEERVLLLILLPLLPRSQRRPRCLGYLGIVTPKLGL